MSPGHFWLLKFGKVPGSNSCVEKEFKLGTHQYEEYKGALIGNGDCALVVDVWLHRVDEDVSGLTFEEWDPSADTDASEAPVAMIVNSSEMRAAGFDLSEVLPLQLEAATRGGQRTRGTSLSSSRFTVWVPGGMYFVWITTMSSGHDVSEYELGASGLPRVSVSPQQPSKN